MILYPHPDVECDLFEFRRYTASLDCEFSQDLAESPDGEELTVMPDPSPVSSMLSGLFYC